MGTTCCDHTCHLLGTTVDLSTESNVAVFLRVFIHIVFISEQLTRPRGTQQLCDYVSARVHAILSTRYLRTKDRRDTFIIAVSSSTSDSVDRIGNDNEKVKRQFVMVILLAVNLTSVCHVVVFG